MRPIMAPLAKRLLGYRLAHLHGAGRLHDAARLPKSQATFVPIETAECNERAGSRFLVLDQRFVGYFVYLERQYPGPVSHEFFIGTIVSADPFEGTGESHVLGVLE